MTENTDTYEPHGCIVCGRTHTMLVVHAPDGRLIDAAVTSPGGRRVPDAKEPLAACESHSPAEIDAALARRRARAAKPDEEQEEEE
jgi:hypothetical protein